MLLGRPQKERAQPSVFLHFPWAFLFYISICQSYVIVQIQFISSKGLVKKLIDMGFFLGKIKLSHWVFDQFIWRIY